MFENKSANQIDLFSDEINEEESLISSIED